MQIRPMVLSVEMILNQPAGMLNQDTIPRRLYSCHSKTICFLDSLGGKVSSNDKSVQLSVPSEAIPPSMWIMVKLSHSSDEDYPPVLDDQVLYSFQSLTRFPFSPKQCFECCYVVFVIIITNKSRGDLVIWSYCFVVGCGIISHLK